MKFNDSAPMPIIAIDFDDTINVLGSHTYPECGEVGIGLQHTNLGKIQTFKS